MANRGKRGTYGTICLTEDCTGNVSEMQARLQSGIWPTEATRARVIARSGELIRDLQQLRRELGWRQAQEDAA